jgi:ABC-type thiamine transport system substrate-binding protein
MMSFTALNRWIAPLMVLASLAVSAHAEEAVLNLYSARHYATDEALYAGFTKATGIKVNRVDADDAGIIARLKAEGEASPADAILLVDAARLYRGEKDGLFKPIQSKALHSAIPENLLEAEFFAGLAEDEINQLGALVSRLRERLIVAQPAADAMEGK